VVLKAAVGASIFFTTDGSPPCAQSQEYRSGVTVTGTTTLRAVALRHGAVSAVAEETFVIKGRSVRRL
jgi:hypothetical protein